MFTRREFVGTVVVGSALLAGCSGSGGDGSETTAEQQESPDGTASDTETAADSPTAFGVSIATPDGSVEVADGETTTIRLEQSATGGTVTDTDWSVVEQPSGTSAAVLAYDQYAELRVSAPGEYTVRLLAESTDGQTARATATVTVSSATPTA